MEIEKILFLIAIIPWAILLLPIYEHFNWNYRFKVAKIILVIQVILLIVQLSALVGYALI